ncbi:hypothetical protein PI93_021640 [Pandoraea fibrosis]|uniref:Uncharacterized protein n=1 Tax=Pandoraea fibrosis TaxID=1891094 RepID=A0ABX6HVK8_9BURK|nr:hypothetical protein [Pandoraea fibrosis]QHE91479.1 hypothetical protein PJ20_006360 [Pandoraea fibrosis]QHF14963.1 hypothetical protein PI93_021640 [Pandoraea fibrosis]
MFPSSLPSTTASPSTTTDTTPAATAATTRSDPGTTTATSSRTALLADFRQAVQLPLNASQPPTQAPPRVAQDPTAVIPLSWPDMLLDFGGAFQNPAAGLLASEVPGGSNPMSPWSALRPPMNKRPFDIAFSDESPAALAAGRIRLMALPEIAPLEPTPSTSGIGRRSGVSISDNVLRKTLLALSDANAQAGDWLDRLESLAVDTALQNGPYLDARYLLEGLVRRLEAEQAIDPWPVAFERVVSLITRFESRTADAVRALLLTHDNGSRDEAILLAGASTHTSIDRLIAHRLHAIADMPAEHRLSAWSDLLAGLRRSTAGVNAERLATLATFIHLLPAPEQRKAADTIVTSTGALSNHDGWSELTKTLLDAVAPADKVAVARAMVHPDRGLYGTPMKATVAVIADHIERVPRQAARDLLAHLIDIAATEGDFDHLVFSCDECIEMLHDLHSTCISGNFNDLATHVHGKLVEAFENYRSAVLD